MKKYKNLLMALLLVATFALAPVLTTSAETTSTTTDDSSASFSLSLTNPQNTLLTTGSHTNDARLTLDWDDVSGASSYELHAWSDTKSPGVRLLSTSQINPDAIVTELTSSDFKIDLIRDGVYYYAVKALAANKDVLKTSLVISVTYDTTAPKLAVINPKYDQEIIGNSLIANGSVSDTNLDYYYFILRDSTGQTLLTSSHIKGAVTNDVLANLDISTFLSGSYDIAFVALDKAGNQTSLTNPDETASFIVLRKGDGNNFSNPPRPTEPAPADIVPVLTPAQTTATSTPKFKLVSTPSVLGAASSQANSLANLPASDSILSEAKIFAVAKTPAKQSHNVLYLALLPILFCIMLLTIEKRQTATNEQSRN